MTRADGAGKVERVELAPGYSISRIVHGAWQLAAGHREVGVRRDSALEGLLRLADAGFTTFDCADIYTGVEELLGEVLRAWRSRPGDTAPPPLQVHTKLVPDRAALPHLDRGYVERVVDRSLRRLGVERLDLVQLHWWDLSVPGWVEAAGWLGELRRAGKIAQMGATNFDAESLAAILDAPSPVELPVVSNQVQISLLDRRAAGALARLARERGVALLGYGSLAGGLLTERWLGAPDPTADGTPVTALPNRSLTKYKLIQQEWGSWDLFQELLRTLRAIGEKHGASIATVALRATLDRPETTAVVLGASGGERLDSTLQVFDLRLDDEDRAAIEVVLAQAEGPEGDVYALERDPTSDHARIMRYDLNRVV